MSSTPLLSASMTWKSTMVPWNSRRSRLAPLSCTDSLELRDTPNTVLDSKLKILKNQPILLTWHFESSGDSKHFINDLLYSLNAHLKEVKSGSVAGPSNGAAADHLEFVFENDDHNEDEDLKSPTPFFFHHHDADLDAAGQNKAAAKLVENIKLVHESLEHIEAFKDTKQFHKVSPFSIIPFVSALDYTHLKQVEAQLKGGDLTE